MDQIILKPNSTELLRRTVITRDLPISEKDLRAGYIGLNLLIPTNLFTCSCRKAFIQYSDTVNYFPKLVDAKDFQPYHTQRTIEGILSNIPPESVIYFFRTEKELYKWLAE